MATLSAKAIPLSLLLVPATSAVLAYLNARLGISYDLPFLSAYIQTLYDQTLQERRDELNLFYVLEEFAVGRPSANKGAPKTAERTFIAYRDREWTFKQTYETALKYGTWFKTKLGVKPGEIIAVDFMNSDTFVFIWFGLWAIGAKPAFVNYNLTASPLVHCVRASSARVLLVDPELKSAVPPAVVDELASGEEKGYQAGNVIGSVKTVIFSPEIELEISSVDGLREPNEARAGQKRPDMATLIFTSGTTGLPKPAIVSWTKMSAASLFIAKYMSLGADDRLYTCMPLYHTSGAVLALCAALRGGSTICIGHKFSAGTFWSDVRFHKATVVQYVGETCRYLLSLPPSPLDMQHQVRLMYGNGLRPEVWNRFKKRFNIPTIFEFYGATEGPTALWNYSTNDFSAGAIGYKGKICQFLLSSKLAIIALEQASVSARERIKTVSSSSNPSSSEAAHTEIPYRDPATGFCRRVPTNCPGELIIKLNADDVRETFQGYFRNDHATSSKILRDVFKPGDAWFRTGDLIRADREGRYFFSDRLGDTFRWKAENVSTMEVSEVLGALPVIADVNVYGVSLPGHDGRCGCAAVVLKNEDGEELSESSRFRHQQQQDQTRTVNALEEIARHVTDNLPYYARPIFLRLSNAIKVTGTNKQVKHELRSEGVDPSRVAASNAGTDRLYWLRGSRYVPFNEADWQEIQRGKIKL